MNMFKEIADIKTSKIYCLGSDGGKGEYASKEMIQAHEGLFGMELQMWERIRDQDLDYADEDFGAFQEPMERLKAYEPELPKDMEPMVYVNYCEKSELGNPRCQKLSDLDSKTVEQDKAWYADRDPNTNEPKTTAQMFFTVYYAEKGDKMLHHFQGKIDIGTGNGGIISQLKMQNEMKLTDESWISYQQGKGNEEYQKYMEDLTDMQNHVLPYLQSFCSLEEKGVKERREQQVTEKNESREAVSRAGVEANTAVKDAGKAERKPVAQKRAMTGKEKKPSIHERLEINKKIIQEKQGKDKLERGADVGVR